MGGIIGAAGLKVDEFKESSAKPFVTFCKKKHKT